MEVEGSCLDTISTFLPHDITAKILSCLPIQEALRTNILSKKWRYRWASIPIVYFDDKKLFEGSSHTKEIIKYKFVNAIYHVLLLHSGSLVEFSLICELEMASDVDHIILYLSRSNTLKKFIFINRLSNSYKLPSVFFSLQGLEHLDIANCNFDPPLSFKGFSRLTSLRFSNVDISTEVLMRLLTNCPLLTRVYLLGENKDITRRNEITFVDLFERLPLVEIFEASAVYTKCFALGGRPTKLSTPLVHLKRLYLNVCCAIPDVLFSTFFLFNNSPNLHKLWIEFCHFPNSVDEVDLQDYSAGIKLDHLKVLLIRNFCNLAGEMEFLKLVTAKAPVLMILKIEVGNVHVFEQMRFIRKLYGLLPFPLVT